jgi:hypothetical protein
MWLGVLCPQSILIRDRSQSRFLAKDESGRVGERRREEGREGEREGGRERKQEKERRERKARKRERRTNTHTHPASSANLAPSISHEMRSPR